MKTINTVKVLNDLGIDLEAQRKTGPEDREKASQFFAYSFKGTDGSAEWVRVESTAFGVMDEILRLPIYVQTGLFAEIAKEVKSPGEQAVLEGDKKRRGARIVRLVSSNPHYHEFLLTH